jgi:hypothetical protein
MGIALGASACARDDKAVPVAESQSQTPVQATNQPVTVTGCLRAGDAEGVFVLTAGGAEGATYHLTGMKDLNLVDHIGRQVEVSGTVRAQQQTTSRAVATPESKATGTMGTPRIETTTELDVKHLDVAAVRPLGERCDR